MDSKRDMSAKADPESGAQDSRASLDKSEAYRRYTERKKAYG